MAEHFRSDGHFIYLNDSYCEFCIPQIYFGDSVRPFAEDRGSYIRVFGVFPIRFMENGKVTEVRILNLPTWIDIFVSQSSDKEIIFPGHTNSEKCRVVEYVRNMKVMGSTIIKDSANAEAFLSLVTKGAIPDTVPYDKAKSIWQKNLDINDSHLGVPSVILELILSAAYRYKNDPTQKFAHALGKHPELTMYDYVMNSIRQICQNTSTYTGLTFEDIDSMAIASVNRTTQHKTEAQSPVEMLLKL